jgi:hypothetical protein
MHTPENFVASYTAEVLVQVGACGSGPSIRSGTIRMVAEVPAAGRRWFCVCGGAGGVVMETKVSGEEGQGVATEVDCSQPCGSVWEKS